MLLLPPPPLPPLSEDWGQYILNEAQRPMNIIMTGLMMRCSEMNVGILLGACLTCFHPREPRRLL